MNIRTLRRLVLGFALLWLLIFCLSFVMRRSSGELRVTFLDVGQGDACVIETPSGKTLVIDTGNLDADGADDMGRRVVAPYLRQLGVNHINVLFLTHPDTDHIGGAATLLEQFPTDLLIDNGQFTRSESSVAARVLQTASARRVRLRSARRGQELTTGDGVTIRVIAPVPAALFGPENDASIVLRIEYGQTAFLLTGDAGVTAETELLTSHQPLTCDVLKAGHHGSRTSSTPAFLDTVHPRIVVFSAGRRNNYGHPAREVLERFSARNVKIYRTDQHGAITCRTDGITLHVETMLP